MSTLITNNIETLDGSKSVPVQHINRAEASTYDSGINERSVESILDTVVPIADYTALRNYTGRAAAVRITTPGIEGYFYKSGTSTSTLIDDGGTIIHKPGAGNPIWIRSFVGAVSPQWFGAKCDGTTIDSTAVSSALTNADIVDVSSSLAADIDVTLANSIVISNQSTAISNANFRGAPVGSPLSENQSYAIRYEAAQQGLFNVAIRNYKDYGLGLKNMFGLTCVNTYIKGVLNENHASGTYGYGINAGNLAGTTFVNGFSFIGGEIHANDVGVVLKNTLNANINTIVEANRYAAIHISTSNLAKLPTYTEANNTSGGSYDMEFLPPVNYSNFSKLCRIQNSYHNPTTGKKLAIIRAATGTVIENVWANPKGGKNGSGVEGRITLAGGAVNTVARNNFGVIIEDMLGNEVRNTVVDGICGNLFKYSENISNAAWLKNGNVNLVEAASTDGTVFLDGSSVARVNLKSTASSTLLAELAQAVNTTSSQYHGRVLGIGVWVRAKTGQSIRCMPVISADIQYTGDNTNAPNMLMLDDTWQFIPTTCVIDSSDAVTFNLAGWKLWPIAGSGANGDGTFDVYIKAPRCWVDSLQPIGYSPTHAQKVEPRISNSTPPVVVADADYTVPSSISATVIYSAAITANRIVTLSTAAALGDVVCVTRTAASTGAFTVSVGGLKSLSAGQWAKVVYTTSGWVVTEFGAL